jgi:predicted enzyme related to lactoylglutathione lyase
MPEVAAYAPGMFCWIELASTDPRASLVFYRQLFGWEAEERDSGPNHAHWVFFRKNREVAGMLALSEHERQLGRPPGWTAHIAVDRIEDTATRAQDLGGRIISGPQLTGHYTGERARIIDPSGAIFALWKIGDHAIAELVGEENTVCWYELTTPRPPDALAYYTQLFGWTTKQGFNNYTEFVHGDRPIAGVVPQASDNSIDPAHWRPFIRVANADATVTSAKLLGATVVEAAHPVEGVGFAAAIRDPQGARLSIVEFT